MAKVLKADCSAVFNSFATKAFSAHDEVWITLKVGFHQAALDFWCDDPGFNYSGDFADIYAAGSGVRQESVYIYHDTGLNECVWSEDNPNPPYGLSDAVFVQSECWMTLEFHFARNDVHEVYVQGTQLWSEAAGDDQIDSLDVGQTQARVGAASIAYIDDVKVGTTRGGTEIFSDDFESGSLAAWDSTTGTVSVVTNPGFSDCTSPTGTVTVTKDGSGSGTVTSSPAGINCGGDCSETYNDGTVVTLTATPAAGSVFAGWTGGGCSGTGTCVLTIAGNVSVVATFELLNTDNTSCADAATISGETGSRLADNTSAAGWAAPDPLFSDPIWGLGYGGGGPLWWKYTNPGVVPVLLRIFLDEVTGSSFDRGLVGIFRGSCGSLYAGEIADTDCDWRSFNGYVADITLPGSIFDYVDAIVLPGETVYIEADGYSGDTSPPPTLTTNRGLFRLRWEVRSVTLDDALEENEIIATEGAIPNSIISGCEDLYGGDSFIEPGSPVGSLTGYEQSTARSDDLLEFSGDVWYSSVQDNPTYAPPLADDFNRADGDPGANWLTPWLALPLGAVHIVSDELAAIDASARDTARWNPTQYTDVEIGLTLTADLVDPAQAVVLFIGWDAAGTGGYYAVFLGDGQVNIFSIDIFGSHLLANGGTFLFKAGDKVRFRAAAGELEARVLHPYRGPANREYSWELAAFATASSGLGYVGVGLQNAAGNTTKVDDFTIATADFPPDPVQPRVVRWDGAAETTYELPWDGRWAIGSPTSPPEDRTEVMLASDGTTLWAVAMMNDTPESEGGVIHPVVWSYDPGTDAFVVEGTMTAASMNGNEQLDVEGEFYLQDVTADASMPGRLYVVWCERGLDLADITGTYWIERQAIGCFGIDAPFAEFDVGSSNTYIGPGACGNIDTDFTCVPADAVWLTDNLGSALLVNDQGVCQLFRVRPTKNEAGFYPWVRCEQVEDDASLTLKQVITYTAPVGAGQEVSVGPGGGATHLSIEPVLRAGEGVSRQADTWVFVVEGANFPGNHPDYAVLAADGIAGVLWRDDDVDAAAGIASTRAAGLQAGMWLVAGNSEAATDFATRCSNAVTTFEPDLLVMDVEFVGKGYAPADPSFDLAWPTGWQWNEDMMVAYRASNPSQATAVTCLPVGTDHHDFNFAAYTSRDVTIWPQSYGAAIPGDEMDPVVMYDHAIANGVSPAFLKMVLPYTQWGADVVALRAHGVFSFAVFEASGMLAANDPPSGDIGGSPLRRTLLITWYFDVPNGASTFAYEVAPLLDSPERWFNNNAQANGNDVLGAVANGKARKTIRRDRFGQTWMVQHRGFEAVFFDTKCDHVWAVRNLPGQNTADTLTGELRMRSGRQVVWHETDGDFFRVVTDYTKVVAGIPASHSLLAVGHVKVLRNWRICTVGDIVTPSGNPVIRLRYRAGTGAVNAALENNDPAVHLSGVRYRAQAPAGSTADLGDSSDAHVAARYRAE